MEKRLDQFRPIMLFHVLIWFVFFLLLRVFFFFYTRHLREWVQITFLKCKCSSKFFFQSVFAPLLTSVTMVPHRSTKGASKARRDHINHEIRNMRALLPITHEDQERLSYLHSMAAICTYIRKSVLFQGEFSHLSHRQTFMPLNISATSFFCALVREHEAKFAVLLEKYKKPAEMQTVWLRLNSLSSSRAPSWRRIPLLPAVWGVSWCPTWLPPGQYRTRQAGLCVRKCVWIYCSFHGESFGYIQCQF